MAAAAIGFRLVLVLFGGDLHLASRPEVSTPLTSSSPPCRRLLAEASVHVALLRSNGQHAHIYCSVVLKKVGGLHEMFGKTYGFILTVKDLSPNIGVLWYFFAEVFDFFRNFFLMVFNMNIIFMVLPLAIRLKHRPCFLAFVYTAIVAILKSYPSAGDSALYLGLLGLFANELAGNAAHGTGNANFYFATGLAYTCLQTVLVVESVSSMIKHDRKLRLLVTS
ncbi:hypothetical protein PR202_gb09414 [Eleusine coracana subsp. coracana]|uniref:Uncharacterized protein n=1 Tax=Eleusine coracana subsp. coracana TaxID=191504 RepID=A0AAV5EH48_ELECO|nr:hypothetical protein PR202_gb09414 [Eleusine coracana subsp. coracana]